MSSTFCLNQIHMGVDCQQTGIFIISEEGHSKAVSWDITCRACMTGPASESCDSGRGEPAGGLAGRRRRSGRRRVSADCDFAGLAGKSL